VEVTISQDAHSLSELVEDFVEDPRDRDAAETLHQRVVRHVAHVTRRYPDAYFELGVRTPEAIEGLADRVFTTCASVEKGRFPFMGRAPFRAFVEEGFEDAPIRYHSFYAKLSITRELLRDDYAFNLRRDPNLRWRDELHRAVGKALQARATGLDGKGSARRWSLGGLRMARSEEAVVRDLRALPEASVEELVVAALTGLGAPITHSRLSNLLAQVVAPPSTFDPELSLDQEKVDERMTVRQAVVAAWSGLSADERELVGALARGESYDSLIARVPAFKNRVAVSRAVKRCGAHFVAQVLRSQGVDPEQAASAAPKDLMEHIVAVLLPMLPELSQEAS
jgi:hypothetical protein